MRNPKLPYSTPRMEKAVVELESPICGGSVDVTVNSPGATTSAQKVNTDFNTDNDFSSGSWDTNS